MVCAHVYGLWLEDDLLAWMECAAPSSYLVTRPLKVFDGYRFREHGIDRCAISWFVSKPGRNSKNQISQPQQLVCGCGNRLSDFQSLSFDRRHLHAISAGWSNSGGR